MPRGTVSVEIEASCEEVFDLIHDYSRRLEWDSMLRRACLLDGASAAGVGVRSLCVGTWRGAFTAMETKYIRFERGRLAAVKLTNRPFAFDGFAATIKHEPVTQTRSRTTYIYSFTARPRLLTPLMSAVLHREVVRRLAALRAYLESGLRDRAA